jgi:hypothetical protein
MDLDAFAYHIANNAEKYGWSMLGAQISYLISRVGARHPK